jgi:hypothetical protein
MGQMNKTGRRTQTADLAGDKHLKLGMRGRETLPYAVNSNSNKQLFFIEQAFSVSSMLKVSHDLT